MVWRVAQRVRCRRDRPHLFGNFHLGLLEFDLEERDELKETLPRGADPRLDPTLSGAPGELQGLLGAIDYIHVETDFGVEAAGEAETRSSYLFSSSIRF